MLMITNAHDFVLGTFFGIFLVALSFAGRFVHYVMVAKENAAAKPAVETSKPSNENDSKEDPS